MQGRFLQENKSEDLQVSVSPSILSSLSSTPFPIHCGRSPGRKSKARDKAPEPCIHLGSSWSQRQAVPGGEGSAEPGLGY